MSNLAIKEFDFAARKEIQDQRIRTQEFTPLGRIVWVSMELQLDHQPTKKEQYFQGRFDWQNNGPLLAISKDHADLLLPGGVTPLPDIPDPTWAPRTATQAEIENPKWKPDTAPLEKQSWLDRPCSRFVAAGETWVVYQPIMEIWFRPFGVPTYAHVTCKSEGWGGIGRRTAMLVNTDPNTGGAAYFYGGVFEIGSR